MGSCSIMEFTNLHEYLPLRRTGFVNAFLRAQPVVDSQIIEHFAVLGVGILWLAGVVHELEHVFAHSTANGVDGVVSVKALIHESL